MWLQVNACVQEAPEHHSLLPLPHPFFIPGQRFRELYYWDSYWVVKGLLISRMPDSAKVLGPLCLHAWPVRCRK